MLIRISRLLLIIIVVFVAAIYFPRYYWKIFDKKSDIPFVMYSVIHNDFLISRSKGNKTSFVDSKGRSYTRNEYEQMLPLFNYRQLISSGKMPDSLRGIKLDISEVRRNNIYIRIKPVSIIAPQIQLFPLFESQSGRIRLEMPDVFFRMNRKMEFLNASTNRVNHSLTRMFTDTLLSKGFVFPAKLIAGNPTTHKPFDEGYFIVDAADKVFHIKMVKGKPFCRNTNFSEDLKIKSIYIKEMPLKEFYGILITENNKLYLISYHHYRLIPLPVQGYNYANTNLLFFGNLFIRNFTLIHQTGIQSFVTDRDYHLIGTYQETWKSRNHKLAGIVSEYLFPFTIQLTSPFAKYVDFYIRYPSLKSIAGIFFFLMLTVLILKLKNKSLKKRWLDLVVVAVSGPYGFIAVLIFDDVDT